MDQTSRSSVQQGFAPAFHDLANADAEPLIRKDGHSPPLDSSEDIEEFIQGPPRRTGWASLASMMSLRPRYKTNSGAIDSNAQICNWTCKSATPGHGTTVVILLLTIMMMSFYILATLVFPVISTVYVEDIPFLPDWGKLGHLGEGLSRYPTDFTRDVLPIPCHSHNDYWRRVPLYEAIHYGCTSVEADVWLFDQELYVGHDTASLAPNRTFRNLYVNPIYDILERQNPSTRFSNSRKAGVFDEDPSQSLILLVDLKTSGQKAFPLVQRQLEVLRSKGYLTHFDGKEVIPGPVTVVGTGDTPFDLLISNITYRDIFFDAPLNFMGDGSSTVERNSEAIAALTSSVPTNYIPENSYYASVSLKKVIGWLWRGYFTQAQLATLRSQIKGAHRQGLKVRYWDTPGWPVWLRNHVWQVLLREGVDMLNVDDLRAAAKMDWKDMEGYWFAPP